jgi:hypothetical protein
MPNLMHIGMPNLKIQSFFLKEKCFCLDETQQTKIQSTVFSNANLEIHLFVERFFWLAIQCKTKFNLDKLDDIGCQDLLFCMFFVGLMFQKLMCSLPVWLNLTKYNTQTTLGNLKSIG